MIMEQLALEESKSNEQHNFDVIANQMWSDQSGMIFDSIFGVIGNGLSAFTGEQSEEEKEEKENLIHSLISNVSCLKNFKIEKPITGRSFGKVFKMSNGHMLKLFSDSLNVKEDMEWYEENYEKAFSGTANKNTLPIYDFGSFDPGDGAEIYYVEMAEVMPLDKWIVHTKRGSEEQARRGLSPIISFYGEMRYEQRRNKIIDMTKEEAIAMTLTMMFHANRSFEPFTYNEAEAIIGAFWELEKTGRQLRDTAARNMGIMRESDPSNPTVIIFDK